MRMQTLQVSCLFALLLISSFIILVVAQTDCSTTIYPMGNLVVHAGQEVQVNCTAPYSDQVIVLMNTATNVTTRLGSHSPGNQTCTFTFTYLPVQSDSTLCCAARTLSTTKCLCSERETLTLLVSPPRPVIVEQTNTEETEIYTCNISCKYTRINWYIGETAHLVSNRIDEWHHNISLSECVNGFHNFTLTVNVASNSYKDSVPSLTCGGSWQGKRTDSQIIYRSLPTPSVTTSLSTASTTLMSTSPSASPSNVTNRARNTYSNSLTILATYILAQSVFGLVSG